MRASESKEDVAVTEDLPADGRDAALDVDQCEEQLTVTGTFESRAGPPLPRLPHAHRHRAVGYYIPANGSPWAAYGSPTDPNGEVIYTAADNRGVDGPTSQALSSRTRLRVRPSGAEG